MKLRAFLFKVTLVGGLVILQSGIGRNVDCALMDACKQMAENGEYPQDDIADVELVSEQEGRV